MTKTKINNYIIPFVLFLISFLLRLSFISKGPYHVDSLYLAMQAEVFASSGKLNYLYGTGYPLTIIISAIFVFIAKLFSISDPIIATNFMSVFLTSISVAFLYLITKKLIDGHTALLSSAMFSVTPIFLGLSIYGKSHSPSLFFLLAGLLALINYKQTKKNLFFWISAVCIGCMGASRLQEMVFLIPAISFLFLFGYNKSHKKSITINHLKGFFGYWLLAALVIILFHTPYLLGELRSQYLAQFDHYQGLSFKTAVQNPVPKRLMNCFEDLTDTLSPVGFGIVGIGLLWLIKKRLRLFLFCLIWISVPIFFYAHLSTYVARFVMPFLPALFIAQGYAFSKLMQVNKPFKIISYIIFFLTFCITFSNVYPVIAYRHEHADIVDYAQWVKSNSEENAVVITSDEAMFIHYYAKRKIMPKPTTKFHFTKEQMLAFKSKIDHLLDQNIPIYVTWPGLYSYDPYGQLPLLLSYHYNVEYLGKHLYESWHSDLTTDLDLLILPLFQIHKK